MTMSGIGTCLGFDGPGEPGSALRVAFELDGRSFTGLNGGPQFTVNESISFVLSFASQAELDEKWDALTADGGMESQCGWLKDKFGVSWQLVPAMMPQVLSGPDPAGAQRAMAAMMGMKKLVIAELQAAYDG
ncbi:VOC family protein [Arthrobacter sp. N199823]|uniref:VOC family protein n=1 Tax=Arthrobacter sp. N199823 TaxID=2058895 RepID=UPI0021577E07|nr:VOC family protein [Arthrobacter sp. N199823]